MAVAVSGFSTTLQSLVELISERIHRFNQSEAFSTVTPGALRIRDVSIGKR
jgi:hypothetical protein